MTEMIHPQKFSNLIYSIDEIRNAMPQEIKDLIRSHIRSANDSLIGIILLMLQDERNSYKYTSAECYQAIQNCVNKLNEMRENDRSNRSSNR